MKSILRNVAAAGLFSLAVSAQAVVVDPNLPEYKPVEGISGSLKSAGSDTMIDLMTHWQEGFKKLYPSVQTSVKGEGSGSAPPALISGTADFGAMSRPMKDQELDEFEKAFGYKPTELATSIDMLAVFVHKDNPLDGLTLQQVDAIFSQTRKGGFAEDITNWSQLEVEGQWKNQAISLYGRNSASGTYGYFKEHALFKGDYKPTVKEQSGSSTVIQGIASDRLGIGYSGIGFATADVRALALAPDANSPMIPATPENAYTGDYPLSRFLLVYVNLKPGEKLDPLRREFVRYVYSKQGQSDVVKAGYFPVTAEIANEMLASLRIESPRPVNAGAPR